MPLNAADTALLQLGQSLQRQGYQFTTVTPLSHQRVNARAGNERAASLRDVFGWSRPFDPQLLGAPLISLLQQTGMLEHGSQGSWSRVRWSSLDGQLFVHSRYPTDEQDAVFFGPDTYRFAQAIDAHLASEPRGNLRIADIGCGAGPGAILAALRKPSAEVWALDINPHALRFTAINAELAGIRNLYSAESHLLDGVEGGFDLILSNPPYMFDVEQRTYRHGGGEHGAGLSVAIVEAALKRLTPGGTLLLYSGVAMFDGEDPFLAVVRPLLHAADVSWHYHEMDPDVFGEELLNPIYAKAERIAAVVLRVTRR